MPIYKDRVRETTTSTGTGSLTLAGAITGYQDFSIVGNNNEVMYSIWSVDSGGNPDGDWEVGIGQYTSSGSLLSRLGVLASSSAGSGTEPVIEDKTETTAAGGSVADITGNKPTGTTAGELLFASLVVERTASGPTPLPITKPTGWTELTSEQGSGGSIAQHTVTFFKVATDSEPANYTFTFTNNQQAAILVILRISGVDESRPIDAAADSTETEVSPDVRTTRNNCLILRGWGSPLTGTTFTVPGTTVSNLEDSGANCEHAIGRQSQAVAGLTGTADWLDSSTARITYYTIAIAPSTYDRINFASGTKRVMLTMPAAKLSLPNVQSFTTAGTHTWVKPPGCKMVEVIVIGGGGGGGSGRKGATADAGRTGGSGASSGGIARGRFKASDLGAVETVTVGAAGTGGVSQTTNSTNGNAGVAGGASIFGNWLRAWGGRAGAGGSTSNLGGIGADGADSIYYLTGSSGGGTTASTGVGANANNNGVLRIGGGGGGGGLVQTTDALGTAGAGGSHTASTVTPNALAGGTAGTAGGNGGNGNSIEILRGLSIGTGGGGGHGSSTTNAGAGGNGGNYGAGGGGGGASKDGVGNSGAGGNGAGGAVMVISY